MTRLAVCFSTVGYLGLFPVAPGTVGSAAGLAGYALLRGFGAGGVTETATVLVLFGLGSWASTRAEVHFGQVDPGAVVIDEVVGMLVTVWWLPVNPAGAALGFVLFRAFDILKPYPAARLEGLPGGVGIMADDVAAGVYAHLLLRLAVWWWPGLAG